MHDWRDKVDLWRLERGRRRLTKAYRVDIVKARKEKRYDDVASLESQEFYEYSEFEDEIEAIRSRVLLKQASRLDIPHPRFEKDSDVWQRSTITGDWFLTVKGRTDLRA